MEIAQYLRQFRETKGEEAWKAEVRRLAIHALQVGGPEHEALWRELTKDYEWLDWGELKKVAQGPEAKSTEPEDAIVNLLRQQLPGIKTQAQYNAVIAAMDALKLLLNAIMEQDKAQEDKAQKALEMAIDVARKATEITSKLEEVPEAATGKEAQEFKKPPAEFQEDGIQQSLLQELESIESLEALNEWYASTKEQRDQVVSQKLRNELLDRIREKKKAL